MGEEMVLSESGSAFRRELGERIKRYRTDLKLDQQYLALAAGYKNASTISELEKGNLNTTLERIEAIAAALGITPHALLLDDRRMQPRKPRIEGWEPVMTRWALQVQTGDHIVALNKIVEDLKEFERIKATMV